MNTERFYLNTPPGGDFRDLSGGGVFSEKSDFSTLMPKIFESDLFLGHLSVKFEKNEILSTFSLGAT